MHKQVRQGDVLLHRIDAIPATAKKDKAVKNRPPIIAYGEVTGHAHGLYGRAAMFRDDALASSVTVDGKALGRVFSAAALETATLVRAEAGTMLGHGTPTSDATLPQDPDHSPIPVEGDYVAIRQREFPRHELARMVAD